MGLRELHCSLARTNPGVPLIVLSVEGDLDNATRAEVETMAQLRLVSTHSMGCAVVPCSCMMHLQACSGPMQRS